jgi:hypothetical protein
MNTIDTLLQVEISGRKKLLWSGQPKQGFKFSKNDWFLIPFSLMWFSIMIWVLTGTYATTQDDTEALLIGAFAPFVLMGSYITFGRFIHSALIRKRTIYGLTDKRAIIVNKRSAETIFINETTEIYFKSNSGNRATIEFGAPPSLFWFSVGSSFGIWTGVPLVPTFEQIEDGAEVYKMIKKQMSL